MPLLGGPARLPYAKTSLRAQQRAMREQMRALGLNHRQIAFEFARRYKLRSRAAWRYAHGWSLTEAAKRITNYAVEAGLGHGVTTVAMTSSHLCEVESWPGEGPEPSGRRPTPYLLSLLAAVYGCEVADLLDVADYEHMRPADRLILDKAAPPDGQRGNPAVSAQTGWDLSVQPGHGEPGLDPVRRGMLVGVDDHDETARMFGAGLQRASHRLTQRNTPDSVLAVPRAYELDDLTYAVIWAVINLDDALLADDCALDQRRRELRAYDRFPPSAVGSDVASDLTSAARLWLGSEFCARHILRNLARPTGVPVFWTREQRGEEACTWLLFRHKHEYLRRISAEFAASATRLARGFCVPETAVRLSPRWERVLLFLSVALMESLRINTQVSTDPGYADVDGFVLLPEDQAIVRLAAVTARAGLLARRRHSPACSGGSHATARGA